MSNEATTTTYVAYQHPGILFTEESVQPVDARNPQQQANDAPDGAFAFFYFDIVTTVVNVEGERIETSSSRRNITKTYYIDAELLTSDQVAALPGDYSILLSNIWYNGWDPIVRCRTGNFQPFEEDKYELVTTS
jgi:hypothetical protein